MHLSTYLKKAGVTTGLLSKNTSHSSLEVIKKGLLGLPQFKGGEVFLVFGNALHEQWLENKSAYKLDKQQKRQLSLCLTALNSHEHASKLLKGSITEEKLRIAINGVEVAFILDIHRKRERVGADLKTTGVRSLNEFVQKAKEYSYFRQAATYILAANLREFHFIAVTKEVTPRVFMLCVQDHPEELRYAKKELEFLLYFYKHYGNLIPKNNDNDTGT